MPVFQGGPMDGSMTFDPRTDDPAPAEAEDDGEGQAEDEESLFRTLIDTVNKLRGLPSVSEQNKLSLEKAGTLIQQIKAAEEKEMEGAMQGKLTPGLLRKANSAPPAGMMGGGPGY
jgi:hypothetical protein